MGGRWVRRGSAVVDAGLSSLGNLAVSLFAAWQLDLTDFGLLATAVLVGLVLVGFSRAMLGDPLTLTRSGAGPSVHHLASRHATSAGVGTALALSPVAGLVVFTASVVAGAELGTGLALAAVLTLTGPLLIVQELMRAVAYSAGRPLHALPNTLTWTGLLVVVLLGLQLTGRALPPAGYLLVWGLTAGAGAVVGLVLNRVPPRPGQLRQWWGEHASLVGRLSLDYSLTQVTAESSIVLISMVAGADEAGLLRKAQLPLAPIVILTSGIMLIGQPGLVRLVARGASVAEVRSLAHRIGLLAGGVSLAAGLVLWLLPASWLDLLLGGDWEQARPLVPFFALYLALGALAACQGVALRALGRLRAQVRLRLWLTPVILGVVTVGALGAAGGAIVALCVGVALVVAAWAWLLWTAEPVLAGERAVEGES